MKAMITTDALGPVKALSGMTGKSGHGVYLLSECTDRKSVSGQHYLRLSLEDVTGRVTAFVWPESRSSVALPPLSSPVLVGARVQLFDGKPQLNIQCLAGLNADDVSCATTLLPRHRCSGEATTAAFDRLAQFECELPAPLNGFLRRILLDPVIGVPFLTCRASVKHHHAYVGGLLVHSTEALDLVAQATQLVLPEDAKAAHLAKLGYLLHDLGKLRSVGEVRRPAYGLIVRHEVLTIELLAPHLCWLEQRSPEMAGGLRSVLDYLAMPYNARRVPRYAIAEVVATVDQWSAAAHNHHDLGNLLRLGRPANTAPSNCASKSPHSDFQGVQQCI